MKSSSLADYAAKYEYLEDGTLVYKVDGKTKRKGDSAGYVDPNGYVRVSLAKNIKEYAHRVVWFIHTGEEATVIDHINGIRTDNRIENLRGCTQQENSRNKTTKRTRKNALPRNVYAQKDGRFRVMINLNGKATQIGSYGSMEEAASSAVKARKEYYGEFAGKETTKDFC